MNDATRATIVSPYPFHMFDQARQLARVGNLERLVTAMPPSRIGLPRAQICTRPYLAGCRHLARRLVPHADPWLARAVVTDFDRWAWRKMGSATVVNALSGFATHTLERAAADGRGVCCDRGSWHILEQKQVLDEEAARIGCPPVRFDAFMIDRELREYELADRILVPSEPAHQSFLRRGIEPSRLAKVPYGVDLDRFSPPTHRRQQGAIVSVGTVGLQKGQHYLVEAFRRLKDPAASLTLVGPIDPGWDVRLDLARGDIRVTGALARDEVVDELQRASLFALASVHEGLALVIAQAMACGLAVVATEATGAAELVTPGVEGLIVPARSTEALAAALAELLGDPERAEEMGRAARRRVERLGGWDHYGEQVAAVLHEVHEDRR